MAIALVASTHAATAGTPSPGINTTGATLIVIACGPELLKTIIITDSYFNTWIPLTPTAAVSYIVEQLYCCSNPTVGAGHTFLLDASDTDSVIDIFAFSGVSSASPVEAAGGTSTTGSNQPGSLTPAGDGYLLVTGLSAYTASTASIGSGFSTPVFDAYSAGTNLAQAASYLIQGTAAAVNPTWTDDDTTNYHAAVMAVWAPLPVNTLTISATGQASTAAVAIANTPPPNTLSLVAVAQSAAAAIAITEVPPPATLTIAATGDAATAALAVNETPPPNTLAIAAASDSATAALVVNETPPPNTLAIAAASDSATAALVVNETPPAATLTIAALASSATAALAANDTPPPNTLAIAATGQPATAAILLANGTPANLVTIAAAAQAATAALVVNETPPANLVAIAAAAQAATAALVVNETPPANLVAIAAAAQAATAALAVGELPPANLVAIAAAAHPASLVFVISAGAPDLKQAIVSALGAETKLTALIGSNLYPVVLPQTNVLANSAALTYKFLSVIRTTNLMTAAGMKSVRVRFKILSYTHGDLEAIKEILRNLFQGFTTRLAGLPIVYVYFENEVDFYDQPIPGSDLGTHSKQVDFLFKLRESIPKNT